jgi:hypothetical protein
VAGRTKGKINLFKPFQSFNRFAPFKTLKKGNRREATVDQSQA